MLVIVLGALQYLFSVKKEVKGKKDIKLLIWYSLFAAISGLGFLFYILYLSYKDIMISIKFDVADFIILILGVSLVLSTLFFVTLISVLLMTHKEEEK